MSKWTIREQRARISFNIEISASVTRPRPGAFFVYGGVQMLPTFERITAEAAAERLGRAAGTIHSWGTRYGARKVRIPGSRNVWYDYNDLMVIEREVYHGHPIPATWQERAEIRERCPIKMAESFPAAA